MTKHKFIMDFGNTILVTSYTLGINKSQRANLLLAYDLLKGQGESTFCYFFNAQGAKYAKKKPCALCVLRVSFFNFDKAILPCPIFPFPVE